MKVTDWKNITISAKEFISGIAFVFTLSGVYYKVYYKADGDKAAFQADMGELKKRVKDLEGTTADHSAQLKDFHDDKVKRDAIEQVRSMPYQQMTRIK